MTEHEQKRGPGRPRKHEDEPEAEHSESGGTNVTYKPLEQGDPVNTEWLGVKFEANVPKEVKNKDLIAAAKLNPWFEVEGSPRAKRRKPTAPPIGPPGSGEVDQVAYDDSKMVEED